MLAKYNDIGKKDITKLQDFYNKEIEFLYKPDSAGTTGPYVLGPACFISKIDALNFHLSDLSSAAAGGLLYSRFLTVDDYLTAQITDRLAKMQAAKPTMKAALAEAKKNMEETKTKVSDGLSEAEQQLTATQKALRFKDRFTREGRKTRRQLTERIKLIKNTKKGFRSSYANAVKNFKFAESALMNFKENKRAAKKTAYKKYNIITHKTFKNTLTNNHNTGVGDVLCGAYRLLTTISKDSKFTDEERNLLRQFIAAFISKDDKSYRKNKEKILVAYKGWFDLVTSEHNIIETTVAKLNTILGTFDRLVKESENKSAEFMKSYVVNFSSQLKGFSKYVDKLPDIEPDNSFKLLTNDLNKLYNDGVKACKEFTLDGADDGTVAQIREKLEYLWHIINLTAAYSSSTHLFEYTFPTQFVLPAGFGGLFLVFAGSLLIASIACPALAYGVFLVPLVSILVASFLFSMMLFGLSKSMYSDPITPDSPKTKSLRPGVPGSGGKKGT